jgi:hypothetical protein
MRVKAGSAPADSQPLRAAPPGATENDRLLRAMTAVLARQRPASAAEALQVLRRGYPDIPLAMRIAALRAGSK